MTGTDAARTPSGGQDADVVVVGYGPVGQTLTALLASRGHRVVVVERWPELFPLPRAGHIDHEIMRVFQSLGIADAIAEDSWEWRGGSYIAADGEVLTTLDWGYEGRSAWYSDYSVFQPGLEALLHDRVSGRPNVELLRGWQVEEVAETSSGARLTARQAVSAEDGHWEPGTVTREITARYVVGCDGANSIVRTARDIKVTDYGFDADWLVVFAEPYDRSVVAGMPDVAQHLDPARPTTAVRSSGKRFCRWEFMVMPGESAESMSSPEVAWELIGPWGLTPDNSRLVRNTVFRFRSLVADQWRSGPFFLAGDAAHLMPPFMGQGLCSGVRDAANLAWKLDLVLAGLASDTLLDTYGPERREHAAAVVRASLTVGKAICVTDPDEARARDAALRSLPSGPVGTLPPLTAGVLLREPSGDLAPYAGELAVQPRIAWEGRTGRSDDVLGPGWTVFTVGCDADDHLSADATAVLDRLQARRLRIDPAPGTGGAVDQDGRFLRWTEELGEAAAVIVRPDFYVFAVLTDAALLEPAVSRLAGELGLRDPAAASGDTVGAGRGTPS